MTDDAQSVLSPHGPAAADIADLAWLLFGVGLAVLVIVLICVALAIGGPPALRRRLDGNGMITAGGAAFPLIVLTALLGFGTWLTAGTAAMRAPAEALRIEVTGEQWWWRIAYVAADGTRIASANEIRMPVGRAVEFRLASADVIHSFWVPALGGKRDMIPGHVNSLVLSAERPGEFRGQCAEYCGGAHALMALRVVAMPPEEFDGWLAREAQPAAASTGVTESRGAALFLAAGCGACHAVRGTAAEGVVGPNLTHVGGRAAIAAETMPLERAALGSFIRNAGFHKPNVQMPPFRILSEAEAETIAAYLLSLR